MIRTEIPLHHLEAARRHLESIFIGDDPVCCLEGAAGVECFQHAEKRGEPADNPDYVTLRDLLDDVIRERSA